MEHMLVSVEPMQFTVMNRYQQCYIKEFSKGHPEVMPINFRWVIFQNNGLQLLS